MKREACDPGYAVVKSTVLDKHWDFVFILLCIFSFDSVAPSHPDQCQSPPILRLDLMRLPAVSVAFYRPGPISVVVYSQRPLAQEATAEEHSSKYFRQSA